MQVVRPVSLLNLLFDFAGDSRCVVCKKGQAVALTEDHKPYHDKEKKRIEAAGHEVLKDTEIVNGRWIHCKDKPG